MVVSESGTGDDDGDVGLGIEGSYRLKTFGQLSHQLLRKRKKVEALVARMVTFLGTRPMKDDGKGSGGVDDAKDDDVSGGPPDLLIGRAHAVRMPD